MLIPIILLLLFYISIWIIETYFEIKKLPFGQFVVNPVLFRQRFEGRNDIRPKDIRHWCALGLMSFGLISLHRLKCNHGLIAVHRKRLLTRF